MFCQIFDLIDRKGDRWHLFGDSASWMKSHYTTNKLNERGGKVMSNNLISVPILNPILAAFSGMKNNFKR
jgi:hypothetical protein